MSYLDLSIRELQAECKERGLQTGRTKDELLVRLVEDDAKKEATKHMGWLDEPGVFKCTYTHVGELDEATHMMFRQRTYASAKLAKLKPTGGSLGAWRLGSSGEEHTYGIRVDVRRDDT